MAVQALADAFLSEEFLTMSVFGALGRSRTYAQTATDCDKGKVRLALRAKLAQTAQEYASSVTEDRHVQKIRRIADELSAEHQHCLRAGRFRVGIAQKALNLYLKYLWCQGRIPTPPHCPFDRRMIDRIPGADTQNWTELDNIDDYLQLVAAAKRASAGRTLSEWELETWEESR